MSKFWQIVINALLYGFLGWLLFDSTVVEWDPWFAFVVAFVLFLAVVISVVPGLRASKVSPGQFPYDTND